MPPIMSRPNRISFAFILLILVLAGWLQMGALLLSVLFSYFVISKLDFMKPRGKWLAVAVFLAILAGLAYALTYFIHHTVRALPEIADRAVPAVIQWATDHQIALPFTDLDNLEGTGLRVRAQQGELSGQLRGLRARSHHAVYLFVCRLHRRDWIVSQSAAGTGPSRRRRRAITCIPSAAKKSASVSPRFTAALPWS